MTHHPEAGVIVYRADETSETHPNEPVVFCAECKWDWPCPTACQVAISGPNRVRRMGLRRILSRERGAQ